MFCRNCGTQNQDGAKFCLKCGGPLDQPVQQAQQPQPAQQAAPQNYGQPQQNFGQPQQGFGQPQQGFAPGMGGPFAGNSIISKFGLLHLVAVGLMVLCLVGLFTPWVGYKIKSANIKKNVSFFGLFDSDCFEYSSSSGGGGYDYDDYDYYDYYDYYYSSSRDGNSNATYLNSYSAEAKSSSSSSTFKDAKTSKNLMLWFGLFGFICIIGAIVFSFIDPKIMALISAGAALMFIVAFFSGISCASKLKDVVKYANGKSSIGFGLIFSFITSLGACACSFISAFFKKNSSNAANTGYRIF